MGAQDEQVDSPFASEVMEALRDLARLAQQAGSRDADAPDVVADRLLERLILLCTAQRGLLILTTDGQRAAEQRSLSTASNNTALRILALHNMREEEAHALLAVFPEGDASAQTVLSEPCWIMGRLPLSAPFVRQQGGFTDDQHTAEQPAIHLTQHFQAWLMLGWSGPEGEASVEKGRHLLSRVTDAAGAVIANLLLAEHVHELETAAEKRAIQDMDVFKAELLATVSHELRSPLASIKGYTATLLRHERRISREERHDFLVAIQEASTRLELIIDRLLELSQLETGAIQITCSALDVVPLVREAISVAQQRVPDHASDRVTFQLYLKDTTGRLTQQEPLIKADPRRLREVLDHVLENAINYSPEGGAIDVILRPVLPGKIHEMRNESSTAGPSAHMPQLMMEICVCDHGLGIPPEHLERIFDRFHRVDTRLTRETSGLGLGLTICKYLVELHDGLIWAESCPAGGSAFHVWLPVEEEETSLAALAETRL